MSISEFLLFITLCSITRILIIIGILLVITVIFFVITIIAYKAEKILKKLNLKK